MTTWRQSSLQWRLTLSLLTVTGLVWSAVLVMTWLNTEHELNEVVVSDLARQRIGLSVF